MVYEVEEIMLTTEVAVTGRGVIHHLWWEIFVTVGFVLFDI